MIGPRTGVAAVSLSLLALAFGQPGERSDSVPKLPGARAVIEAAEFESLQAAVDALPAEGGVVRLPAGRFELMEPLVVTKSDVQIVGAGTATWLHNANTGGQPALVLRHPLGPNPPREERVWRVKLADFRLTGNEKSGAGIVAHKVNELFLHGVSVSGHGGDGVLLDECYEDPRVCDCLFTYNRQTGLNLVGCHDIVVSANQFEENGRAVRCVDSFNLCMTGNCVDDHLGEGVRIENTYGSVLAGNMIEECAAAAVVLDRDCYGIALSANVIAHNGAGIDLRDAHGCAVSANAFTINKADAVRVGPASGRIAVTGNNFSNSDVGDGRLKREADDLPAAGLVLEGAADVAADGNVFAGLTTKALTLAGAPGGGVVFADNVLADVESDHARLEGPAGPGARSPEGRPTTAAPR